MGPIGCLFLLIGQVFHMVVMLIALPIVIITSIFSDKDNE